MKKILLPLIAGLFIPFMAFAGADAEDSTPRAAKTGESEFVFSFDGPEGVSVRIYQGGTQLASVNPGASRQIVLANGSHTFEARPVVYDTRDKEYVENENLAKRLTINGKDNRISVSVVARKIHSQVVIRSFSVTNTALHAAAAPAASPAPAPNTNDAARYWQEGYAHYTANEYAEAIAAFEKCLSLDPNYRVRNESGYSWTPEVAARFGINTTEEITFNNFSLHLFIGETYYASVASRPASNRATVEKALYAFSKGYQIDIIDGANNNTSLEMVYLGYSGKMFDLLGRPDDALVFYRELAEITTVTSEIAQKLKSTPSQSPGGGTSVSVNGVYRITLFDVDGQNNTNSVGDCYVVREDDSLSLLLLQKGKTEATVENSYGFYVFSDYNSSAGVYETGSLNGEDQEGLGARLTRNGNRVTVTLLYDGDIEIARIEMTKTN